MQYLSSLCIPFADVESVMNSIVSLLLILETEKQEALIESLCEKLVKFREGERPSLRMQLWVLYPFHLLFTAMLASWSFLNLRPHSQSECMETDRDFVLFVRFRLDPLTLEGKQTIKKSYFLPFRIKGMCSKVYESNHLSLVLMLQAE